MKFSSTAIALTLLNLLLVSACSSQKLPASSTQPSASSSASEPIAAPTLGGTTSPEQATPSIAPSVPAAAPGVDREIFLDDKCQPTSTNLQSGGWRLIYQTEFTAQGQAYWLTVARFVDGGTELCLSQPNFVQPRPIDKLNAAYITRLQPDPSSPNVFLVRVREGNGRQSPLTQYRLDLSNPAQPSTTSQPLGRDNSRGPQLDRLRVEFPAGATGTVLTGRVSDDRWVGYLLQARAGQRLTVRLTSPDNRPDLVPDVTFNIMQDETPTVLKLESANRGQEQAWSGQLPATGDYRINVIRPSFSDHDFFNSETPYRLEVTIQ